MTHGPAKLHRGSVWLGGILSLALALGSGACNKAKSSAPANTSGKAGGDREGPPKVTVVSPEPSTGGDVIMGTLVANRQITVTPQAGGRIQKLHAKLGDYVKEGDPLVTLDPKDANLGMYRASASVAVAKAAVALAQTGLANAWNEYKRFKKLYENKTIPEATFTRIKTAWLMAKAQVNLAKQQVQLANAGAAGAFKNRKDTVTRAPFGGIVTRVMLHKGDMVRSMPPSHVMLFADVTPVIVEASVGELQLHKLPKSGQRVKLVFPGLGNKVMTPNMGRVLPALNAITRAATLRIELPNADRSLQMGLSVEIHLDASSGQQLTLPSAALKKDGTGAVVFRVKKDGLLEKVSVSLGAKSGSRVVVKSGVSKSDRIVADASRPGLAVGQRVTAVSAQ